MGWPNALDNTRQRSTFDFDQTSLNKAKHARLHSIRWPNALDIALYMNVERCIVKNSRAFGRGITYIRFRKFALSVVFCSRKLGHLLELCLMMEKIPPYSDKWYLYDFLTVKVIVSSFEALVSMLFS